MRLKKYLRKLKEIVEKEGYQKSEHWELYQELFKIQTLESKFPINIYIKVRPK